MLMKTEPSQAYIDQYNADRMALRLLLRTRVSAQSIRKAVDGRLGRKADGKPQNLKEDRKLQETDFQMMVLHADSCRDIERQIEKDLIKILKRFKVYSWLKEQKGVGTVADAWLIGEIDIFKANTVSKIWSFSGLNPGLKQGMKSILKKKYKPEDGEIIKELPKTKKGEARLCVLTDRMIRGDKMTKDFLCPFNKNLRTALVGVLADGFIKAKAPYALNYYYPYKHRLENSDQITKEIKNGGQVVELPWKDTIPFHRDRAAKRKMIKDFLKDLYVVWRESEGLSVRPPYAEEYLGKKHDGSEIVHWKKAFPETLPEEGPSVCLRSIRKREGLTQNELADKSGVSRSDISAMERGKIPIDVDNAKKLALALNIGFKVLVS
ncbi:MAG: helix-turn-helix transcriptional regulator [Candidatus Omnitrophota bacterium]